MALKIKIALCLAAFTGALTAFLSILNSVRASTVFYRGIFTFILFFALGYIMCLLADLYLKKTLENENPKGKNIDIIDEQAEINLSAETETDLSEEEVPDTAESVPEFKPLTPDNMMNFSTAEK